MIMNINIQAISSYNYNLVKIRKNITLKIKLKILTAMIFYYLDKIFGNFRKRM